MKFDHEQLATAAFLEHHILMAASHEGLLDRVSKQTLGGFGVSEPLIAPFLQVRVLTLSYCLLVYPSELWTRRDRLAEVIECAQRDADLPPSARSWFDGKALRHLRNAASHARIEFDGNSVEFSDVNPQGKVRFRECLTYEDAPSLLLVLGRAFHESHPTKGPLH